jgi:hypothetical protein
MEGAGIVRGFYLYVAVIFFFVAMTILCVISLVYPQDVKSKTIAWSAPTHNSDGTILDDLSGYNVYASDSEVGPWTKADCDHDNALDTRCAWPIPIGVDKWVFIQVTAFDDATPPNESIPSNILRIKIDSIVPNGPTELHIIVLPEGNSRVLILEQ